MLLGGWGHSEGREGHEPKQQVGAAAPRWSALLYRGAFRTRSFRQRLLDDPKGTIEQELGSRLPEDVEVRVVEESTDTIYLVLPSASPVGEAGELSEQDLEEVAGGEGNTGWEFLWLPALLNEQVTVA